MLELATVIKEEFAPLFRSLGFKGSGSHYRRCRESFIDCIKIQRSKDGCSFCINLGVHPIFALKDKTEEKEFQRSPLLVWMAASCIWTRGSVVVDRNPVCRRGFQRADSIQEPRDSVL
jgi:hypothetical protein